MVEKNNDIRDWVIYKITSPTGRVYIGKSCNYRLRLNQYRSGNNSKQKLLNNSLNKYGFNNHYFEIIDSFTSDLGYVNGKEIFWIRSHMSNINKWPEIGGMNLTDGGEGQLGRPHTEEVKAKMRERNIKNGIKPPKVIWTDEMRKKMSELKKGNPKIGRKRAWSEEQRKQMAELKKGHTPWNKGKNYNHIPIEERKLKFGKQSLGNSYNKGRKLSSNAIAAIVIAKSRSVSQYTLDGKFLNTFKSIREAHVNTGLSEMTIIFSAKGKTKRPKKFIFKYNQ